MKLFNKTILYALIAALAVASLPFVSGSAAGSYDLVPQRQITNERLERIWSRQLRRYERFGYTDEFITRVQRLIDRAKANGKDVTAVKVTLDAFAAAVKETHPIFESMKGIVNWHQGFDSNGKVTVPEKAKETVRAMHDKFQEIKSILNGTGKALRETIKAFRQANPRPSATATP